MSWLSEGIPRNMKPVGAGEELVGVLPVFEEVHEFCELRRIFRTDVGSLTDEVLGVLHATHLAVHSFTTETRINYDGSHEESCRFQQLMAAISHVRHILHRGDILRIFAQVEEFAQTEMLRQFYVILILFHGSAY